MTRSSAHRICCTSSNEKVAASELEVPELERQVAEAERQVAEAQRKALRVVEAQRNQKAQFAARVSNVASQTLELAES